MQVRQDNGQLVGLVLDDPTKQRMTTQRMLEMESANVEKVRAGQDTQQPITKHIAETQSATQGMTLSESQRAAVKQIVTSRDQITGLQGGAGTGKTTALAAVRETAERAGYDVQGFAPTTRATQLLAESGMQTRTLQKFLRQKAEPDAPRRFYVLDESSLASTKAVNSFLSRVRPEDRVLLVGDVKQHEAVEAGSPFAQLQRHGMATAKLEKIVRQKDAPLREVVEHLSIGKIKEAIEGLQKQGRITEIADPRERLTAIAKDYCEQPANALVISPANKERVELNQLIHERLQSTGQISKQDYRTKVLENRNELSGAERTFAAAYQPDDVIRYTSASKKHDIGAGEYARVLSTSDKDNTITVKLGKSQREVTYNPQRLQGVTVYREAEREFATGDRLQFRAPHHPERVANGELGTLEKIEKGTLTVALDSGRKVSFPIEKNRHIDYGYAVTSHSSQGQTIDRVLINADTRESDKLLNQRMSYVASSRARLDARIYTDSAERLSAALARQVDKSTALEASREAHETKRRNVASLVPIEKVIDKPRVIRELVVYDKTAIHTIDTKLTPDTIKERLAGDGGRAAWTQRAEYLRDAALILPIKAALGEEVATSLELDNAQTKLESMRGQDTTRRHKIVTGNGKARRSSIRDVEALASAQASRHVNRIFDAAYKAEQTRPREEQRSAAALRAAMLEETRTGELEKQKDVIAAIGDKHAGMVDRFADEHAKAKDAFTQASERANVIRRDYKLRAEELPAPMISATRLDDLEIAAVDRGAIDSLKTIEGIRSRQRQDLIAQGVEASDPRANRSEESAACIKAQHRLSEVRQQMSEHRLG